ncbi:hypothetical protein TWF481_004849 [Arthrobotrys musiformis]|uniref:HNH nuclease domain-containing protein n=1 Tax=Arthrobotrys musiformis TaxID=47236 RepID=A0AAV9WKR6_9PEZI
MVLDLTIKTLKLLSHLRHHRHLFPRPIRYLNIGFLTQNGNYKQITLPLNPAITALQISCVVASHLHLPHELDSTLQVSLLPYGFATNDHRLLSFIELFPRNLVHKEKYISNLAPRKPPFPSFPAKRYRGRTLNHDEKILPLLKPWRQDALHLWVWLGIHDERILRYQDAIQNCQLIISEKERMDAKCQDVSKPEVARAYKLKYSIKRELRNEENDGNGNGSKVSRSRSKGRRTRNPMNFIPENEKRYRCQITDEYFTLDRMAAVTIYPHSLMLDLPNLNEKVVDMLTGPENMLLMSWPVARMFDEGLITIEKKLIDDSDRSSAGPDDHEREEKEEFGYFLKVSYTRLLDSRVFAKEDWEDREHRERLRWKNIDGKRIIFSDDGKMMPYHHFLAFHSQLSAIIFSDVELVESEGQVQNTLARIFDRNPNDGGSDSYDSEQSSVFTSRAGSPPPPRWHFPINFPSEIIFGG